jgi:NAD(P)-dependent dehydrogenase (short-subunit alcohol dehydrogenase family)
MDAFRDRVAVITGGAGGIGGAMARAFAARGAKLVLADVNEEALARAEKEHRERGTEVLAVTTDVTERASVFALADATYARFGAAHVVCNNAGIAILGPITETSQEDWEFTMAVNFWGVLYGVQAFLPRMLDQARQAARSAGAQRAEGERSRGGSGLGRAGTESARGPDPAADAEAARSAGLRPGGGAANWAGHIVNTSSMAGLAGMAYFSAYNASKFAVVGLSESLQRELKPHGIGVSVLCPMIVQTNLGENTQRLRQGVRHVASPPPTPPAADTMVGGVKQPDEVAARVARAIESNQLYVLTHDEQREILRRRAARFEAVFEPDAWEL